MTCQSGTLWIVATPIGTLDDLSPRAARVLAEVDVLLAEDTRRTGALLRHLGVDGRGRLRSCHEHNEDSIREGVLRRLEDGGDAALVSDAGTPVLSDPGFGLVRAARSRGLAVASVPGPSAFTAALAASGQPPLPATLVGFLPSRAGPRRRLLDTLRTAPGALVIFLSPHRLGREIAAVAEVLGGARPATLLAEISKRFERAHAGVLESLVSCEERPRGEYVLVVGPDTPPAEQDLTSVSEKEARAAYEGHLAAGVPRREAIRRGAEDVRLSRREFYALLFEKKES
jgi:16S rRNA (cytidine1402-2'-O)-methyltransferase